MKFPHHLKQVVREHYLRDDVWCSVAGCVVCGAEEQSLQPEESSSDVVKDKHILVIDTNVALHQVR